MTNDWIRINSSIFDLNLFTRFIVEIKDTTERGWFGKILKSQRSHVLQGLHKNASSGYWVTLGEYSDEDAVKDDMDQIYERLTMEKDIDDTDDRGN